MRSKGVSANDAIFKRRMRSDGTIYAWRSFEMAHMRDAPLPKHGTDCFQAILMLARKRLTVKYRLNKQIYVVLSFVEEDIRNCEGRDVAIAR
jgi:hypothetical protein